MSATQTHDISAITCWQFITSAHTVQLEIDALINSFGPDYPVPATRKHIRCTRCGSDSCTGQLVLPKWHRQAG